VDIRLVQCFFKMKDAENLKKSLEVLERSNQASYNALPPAILRWCGWTRFQSHDYLSANKYLSDALPREPREKYTAADGSEQERPKVEPIVWKTLARARLELRLYARGLEAAEHYVSMEKQPYRQAEGMRDQALLLIGLNRGAEARKLCETAIAMGIDGPIKSTLFIALGDAYYIDREYSEAAKYYGRTANVVSDKELKPLALYKITCALKRCGKDGEASQYEQALRTEFPDWKPDTNLQQFMEAQPAPQA
jgi:tetratricopeptide (TPR) repeat protein